MIFRRCASILAQYYEGVGGREEGRGGWGGGWVREEEKPSHTGKYFVFPIMDKVSM